MPLSRFFVDRPIFAWVIAIVIMMGGLYAIARLAIEQYPDMAPPEVSVSATYPGASAETLETSVTQVLEQQLTGIDGLLYFSSSSDSSGIASISITFSKGTNPEIAQVQVQNRVQQALSRLPIPVQQQGLSVVKRNSGYLMIVTLADKTNRSSDGDIGDYLVSRFQDELARVDGVGQVQLYGGQYAMRIWLDPVKLAAVKLMPSDIAAAIQAQNTEVSAGQIGQNPAVVGQMLNAVVKAKARFTSAGQFRAIVVKTQGDGSVVRLSDVARVEIGQEDYSYVSRVDGHPASGISIRLAPGADALKTAAAVKARVAELGRELPAGYVVSYSGDATDFIKLSVLEVIETLVIAIVLVMIVMFLFLQSWRGTLIPAIAVPVVLLGTCGVLVVFGYSINTLTLFGMVLAIGLLVDDAIVVVENVERIMTREMLGPREATIQSMNEISSALVGIALVLSAVFLPMAFFDGSTGVIYRQFSITIVSSMVLSVLVALILSPALCATLLKSGDHDPLQRHGLFGSFNRWFDRMTGRYVDTARNVISHRRLHLGVYALLLGLLALLFVRLPTGFLPTEDQGELMVQYTLPAGATLQRTEKVGITVERYLLERERTNIASVFAVDGIGFGGAGANAGTAWISLAPFGQRRANSSSAEAIGLRAVEALSGIRDAQVFATAPPAIMGFGQSSGFTFELLNTSGMERARFTALRDKLVAAANRDPKLSQVRATTLPDMPQLRIDIDETKLAVLGLNLGAVTSTLSTAWGGTYVNDFIDRGRVKRVYLQADSPFRMRPNDLDTWFVRASNGTMTPFSAFATSTWEVGPSSVWRFNGRSSYEIQGEAAPGASSGDAMKAMEALQHALAPGTTSAWSGISYQERQAQGQAPYLYALSILIVFLCLAALYESGSIPLAVLLVLPIGLIGAVLAVTLRDLDNNVYFQVGLVTTIGLTAKNAVLIVEFAEAARRRGEDIVQAALEGARLRLRPILMTSIAFIVGVLPLAIATGAGARSRMAIGTAVSGGTLTATVLAIFYVPMFFVLVARLLHRADSQASENE
ncbi:multidrug efflux pump [Enhydrobacter aerosaccus]|uniref:Efflux pump membrane transporter n=1 Tax=Enhydrobacter aerosaccus TaxID=225324 RepID=A0A1T4TK80_9HYPH|nr:efflux RND transporter permease subunit [Enhydrobacter aerosaccus]SKA40649.1 multidrug efflux pump [Enhydrobacter aerosaccus]